MAQLMCPLLAAGRQDERDIDCPGSFCREENCAWWIENGHYKELKNDYGNPSGEYEWVPGEGGCCAILNLGRGGE